MKEQTTSIPNGTRLEILRPARKNQPIEGPISARLNAQAVKILDAAREGPSGHGPDWQECGIRRALNSLISYGCYAKGRLRSRPTACVSTFLMCNIEESSGEAIDLVHLFEQANEKA